MTTLEIEPFAERADYERMVDYFLRAERSYLEGMGVDPQRLPARAVWLERLLAERELADRDKQLFYVSWLRDGVAIGHSNINRIRYAEDAYAHLHIWLPQSRRAALGAELFRRSVNLFLRRFELRRLYCEPFAHNPAPNRVLSKLGFALLDTYRTVPGAIAFEQDVNRWVIEQEIPERLRFEG
jgi:RimJ/RimL family protein N-acetyltransferase